MRKMQSIRKTADGFLKKYEFTYDVDGETVLWDVVSIHELKEEKDVAAEIAGVQIIARFEDGDILVCREFRYPLNSYVHTFPGGLIDPGETPEQAAIRELKEETGLDVVRVDKVLPPVAFAEGIADHTLCPVFLTVRGELQDCQSPHEEIHPMKLSPAEVREMIARKDILFAEVCLLVLYILFESPNEEDERKQASD